MKTKLILILICCLYLTSFAQWKPTNGLFSGEVHSVIKSNNEIIVGTKYIYKSSDSGKTWFVSNNGISGSVSAIRGLVKISSNIVAASDVGVYYSTDNGNNWTQCAGTSSLNVWSIIVKGSNLFLSTSGNGIYKSTTYGVTWNACNTNIPSPFLDMRCIAIKGTDLYAGSDGRGIYKSINDGTNWTTVNTGLPGSYYAVSALAAVGSDIFAGTYGAGVYKSTDNGAHWNAVNNGISSSDDILAMGVNGTSIYASTLTGNLYKTTDNTNWNSVAVGTYTATRFESFYSTGSEFYIGAWGYGSPEKSYGVFKTLNDGTTWKHIGITDYPVSVLEVSGSNILGGTFDVSGNSARISLYKTTETDSTWTYNVGGFDGRSVTALKANGAVMYLFEQGGSNNLVYRSVNNGNNWTSTGFNVLVNDFVSFAIAGSLIYAADNSPYYTSNHAFVSSDNGATWNSVSTGLPTSGLIAYSLALKGTSLFLATNNGVYKNTVGANNWTAVNIGLTNLIIKSIYLSGTTLYAGTQGSGIFKSVNDGGQWTEVNTGIPLYASINCFTSSGSNVFAGTDNGVFVSSNNGSSWGNVSTGLIDTSITVMIASPNYLWAGTYSQGVWRRELSQFTSSVPPTPGSIQGSSSICSGSVNNYSVSLVAGATSYTWTLPNGWIGTSTNNSINATAGNTGGTISVTANNSFGSSSAQILNVTVRTVNTSVTQSGLTLTANAAGSGYVWINCSNYAPVGGQTSQSFTAPDVGNYAVIVTQNSCSDTSACFLADTMCYTSMSGSDLPYNGLNVLLAVDTLTNVSLGNSGVSQSWNYSALSPTYMKFAIYDASSSTPYAATFPLSNIFTYGPAMMFGSLFGTAPVGSASNGYVFWESDNTGLWATGFRTDTGPFAGINVVYDAKELLIGVPASYESVFNNTSKWILALNRNTSDLDTFYVRRCTKTITADACGSLTTPHGFYQNVLREHEYVTSIDSIYIKLNNNIVTAIEFRRDTLNNYIYLSSGIGYPACIVHADKDLNVMNVEYYYGEYNGVNNKKPEDKQYLIYPNPSEGKMTIEFFNGNIQNKILIYNSVGSLVWQNVLSGSKVNLDISNLPKGIYFIRSINKDNNIICTEKIVLL